MAEGEEAESIEKEAVGITLLFGVAFGAMAGSIYWVDSHAGFDILTDYGIPQSESFYYYRDVSGLHILYHNNVVGLNTTLLPMSQINSCYLLQMNVNIAERKVSIESAPVGFANCEPASSP